MPPEGPSPALFFDTISAYQRTEALRAAVELDLFSLVAAGRQTATELANACQAAPRGIRILADYLTIIGFLTSKGTATNLPTTQRRFSIASRRPIWGRGWFHARAPIEGELSTTDGGRAAGRHGGFRRGNSLPRQLDLG